jgi:G:T-mismatch repair DNA endonuclease (very short patch repair protein)
LAIGNIEVFLEAMTIASACNKVLRKRFLKPDTIGLIHTGGYSGNVNYSKKSIMWLIYKEQIDGCEIWHGRNGREYRLPELPYLIVDGYCPETKKVYEFFGCYWHGHTCLRFRDVKTMNGDTLAERYEKTMTRSEQITRAGYQVEIQWECEFDEGILSHHPELQTHPLVEQSLLNTRESLYGGRTEAMRLHYKTREEETIPYRVSHELRSLLRESVPYVKIYRYNPKHLYPKLNGYGDNGQRSLKL